MREHPFVTAFKIGLLVLIVVGLALHFVAINETQGKVIETARRVDEIKDELYDVRTILDQGVRVGGGAASESTGGSPAASPETLTDLDAYLREDYEDLLSPEPDPPRPDDEVDFNATLRHQLPVEPKGLNIYTSDRDQYVAVTMGFYVYPTLAERKNSAKDEWKPGLAERVLRSPDRRTYIIRLRQGVLWQRAPVDLTDPRYAWMRGKHEVTAEDVLFALRMILDERADTDNIRSDFEDVESSEQLDRYTLRVTWKEPNFYAAGLTLTDLRPIAKWIFTREEDGATIDEASLGPRFASHWFNKKMCGCGPYAFKEYKTSDYILLERNEAYWGRRPGFKHILYKLSIRQDQPRYNMFMRINEDGTRDQHMYAISPVRWRRDVIKNDGSSPLRQMLARKEIYIWAYQRMMYAYTGWACRGKFFNDKRVRRAMTLAANRPVWKKDILDNIAIFPTGIAYTESPEYDRTVPPWPYDLEEASRLLEGAGWTDRDGNGVREKTIDGEKVEFHFKIVMTPSSPELEAIQSDWQQSLRKIGVIMEPQVVEWNLMLKKVRDREFDAFAMAWHHGDDFIPDSLFHSKLIEVPGSHNYVEWSHARADEIMDALKREFDLKKRYELCHELHRIFHEEQPYTVTWSWRNPVAHDAHIGGLFARNFSPQVDYRYLYWMKDGPAQYDDGRDRVPTKQ